MLKHIPLPNHKAHPSHFEEKTLPKTSYCGINLDVISKHFILESTTVYQGYC